LPQVGGGVRVGSVIGGRADIPAGAAQLPVFEPATGQVIAELAVADAADVDAAVDAARRAFPGWRMRSVAERQTLLRAIAARIEAAADQLAALESANTGLLLRQLSGRHVPRAAYNFRFFADFIGQSAGQSYRQEPNFLTWVDRHPVGVAALIAPWNAPLALASMKVAAAIAFGNTCVLKPSEQTPLAFGRFMELLAEAGLPPGVVNLVNGPGAVTGAALVAHAGVDRVSFTGGTSTGRQIMAAAAATLTPVTLELGGKSAALVFADANLERALDGALLGIFSNNGQQCLAGSRILVQRSIADTFIERFLARTRRLRVGDPGHAATELGPLGSQAHLERVLGYARLASQQGAQLLCGGQAHECAEGGGYYLQPTVALAPDSRHPLCQEEIFAPFATFLVFDEEEEAIAMANDSRFGLVSYLWSENIHRCLRLAQAVETGVCWINTPMMRELRAPFGGLRESGVGAEGGAACERFYTQERTVSVPVDPQPLPQLGR